MIDTSIVDKHDIRNIWKRFGIICLCIAVIFLFTTSVNRIFYDPDSYYFLGVSEGKFNSDSKLSSLILYKSGLDAALFANAVVFVFICWLVFSMLRNYTHDLRISYIFAGLCMISPLLWLNTMWPYILDKNLFTLLIFMIFLKWSVMYDSGAENEKKNDNGKYIDMLIICCAMYVIWQGYFIILLLVSGWLLTVEKRRYMIFIIVIFTLVLYAVIMKTIFFSEYMLVSEFTSVYNSMAHPEIILIMLSVIIFFMMLFMNTGLPVLKRLAGYESLSYYCIFFIILSFISRRFMIFMIPVSFVLLGIIYHRYDDVYHRAILIAAIAILMPAGAIINHVNASNMPYDDFSKIDYSSMTCIMADWSYGHVLNYYSNITVMYYAHPGHVMEEMYYMYYGNNKTNCTIIMTSLDPMIFERYRFVMDLPGCMMKNISIDPGMASKLSERNITGCLYMEEIMSSAFKYDFDHNFSIYVKR